jgi:hypothetical protein
MGFENTPVEKACIWLAYILNLCFVLAVLVEQKSRTNKN